MVKRHRQFDTILSHRTLACWTTSHHTAMTVLLHDPCHLDIMHLGPYLETTKYESKIKGR